MENIRLGLLSVMYKIISVQKYVKFRQRANILTHNETVAK